MFPGGRGPPGGQPPQGGDQNALAALIAAANSRQRGPPPSFPQPPGRPDPLAALLAAASSRQGPPAPQGMIGVADPRMGMMMMGGDAMGQGFLSIPGVMTTTSLGPTMQYAAVINGPNGQTVMGRPGSAPRVLMANRIDNFGPFGAAGAVQAGGGGQPRLPPPGTVVRLPDGKLYQFVQR